MFSGISRWVCVGLVVAGTVPLATAAVLTVGQSGANYTSFHAAVGAARDNDIIRFIDSAVYEEAGNVALYPSSSGLTIESAPGQRATVKFTAAGSGYGLFVRATGNDNVVIRNLNFVGERSGPVVEWFGDHGTLTGVNFSTTVSGGNTLLETGNHMAISYSTFRGAGIYAGGDGISWTSDTLITVDHCSFDKLRMPIFNPWNNTTTTATVTNSAFGDWYPAGWAFGITVNGPSATGFEDYNSSYAMTLAQPSAITSGGHSLLPGSYAATFAGDTGTGDWSVQPALLHAASDGTAIGAWQVPEPTTLGLLAVGSLVAALKRRRNG